MKMFHFGKYAIYNISDTKIQIFDFKFFIGKLEEKG